MSLTANELFSSVNRASFPRAWPKHIQPKDFAAGSGVIAKLSPVARVLATGFWKLWQAAVAGVDTLTFVATVSGGSYTLTLNGLTTAAIQWNDTAATVQAALEALGTVKPGDIVATGGPGPTNIVLTYGRTFLGNRPKLTTSTSLTGGGSMSVVATTAGSEDDGSNTIAGFLWPDDVTLDAGGQVIGNVMMSGLIHIDDIPIVSGYTLTQLQEALRNGGVRQKGFTIQGLVGF